MKKTRGVKRVEITKYTDYAAYIADVIQYKQEVTGFSYRVFCRKSGFKSPTYLKWVIGGVRPISLKSVHKFIAGLSLDKREAQYFTLMVNYKEARSPETKRFYYEQMLAWQKRRSGPLTQDAYEFLSHWYYVAIRELIASPDFKDDPHWIRDRLDSDLSLWEIKNGLETLERLQLIKRNPQGHWQLSARDFHTGNEIQSLAAFNYHSEMLDLAQNALSRRGADERDFRSLVVMIDKKTYKNLKIKIYEFQKELVDYLEKQQSSNKQRSPKELYALNLQLMPLTKRRKEKS